MLERPDNLTGRDWAGVGVRVGWGAAVVGKDGENIGWAADDAPA